MNLESYDMLLDVKAIELKELKILKIESLKAYSQGVDCEVILRGLFTQQINSVERVMAMTHILKSVELKNMNKELNGGN